MEKYVKLPEISKNKEKAILCEWCATPGDIIHSGELLCVIEVNKVTEEIYAEYDMEILYLLIEEGDEVAFGENIAKVRKV